MSELDKSVERILQLADDTDSKISLGENYIKMILHQHHGISMIDVIDHLNMVRRSGADPLRKQVYFTSYETKNRDGSKKRVGATVFSYRFFEDIANRTNEFEGCECQIEVDEYFDPVKAETEKTLKANATAYRSKRKPIVFTAWYPEFVQTKYDGTPVAMWKTKPHLMLRKCAIAGALRSQFPETLGTFLIEGEVGERYFQEELQKPDALEEMSASEKAIKSRQDLLDDKTRNKKELILEAIKETSSKITAGDSPEKKVEWMKTRLLVDSFKRLESKTIEQLQSLLESLIDELETPKIIEDNRPSFTLPPEKKQ